MANINILSLPVQTAVNGTEYLPIVSGLANNAVTRRVQIGLISGFTSGTTTQAANTFYAGPSVPGPTSVPTFRLMVTLDLPQGASGTLISGGGAVGSILTLQSTAGVGTTDAITFQTGASQAERARFDTSGNFLIGATSAAVGTLAGSITPVAQIHGLSSGATAISNNRWSNDANAPVGYFAKSRGATIGTHVAVQSGDGLGALFGYGSDGTAFQASSSLRYVVDGAVSAGIVPGRMAIFTQNLAGTFPEAIRFDSAQTTILGGIAAVAAPNADLPFIQVLNNANRAGVLLARYTAAASGPDIYLAKSRSATLGTQTIVTAGDTVGNISGSGSDGTNFIPAARISFLSDAGGTPSTGIIPGRISMFTANSAGVQTEGARLDFSQNFFAFGKTFLCNQIAIPAGGTTQVGINLSTAANFGVYYGSGSPTLSAAQGSLYLNSTGYPAVNLNGSTVWYDISAGFGVVTASVTNINFNSANTDTTFNIPLPLGFTRYRFIGAYITHASASITTATCGIFTATGGGGTVIVASGTAITVNTGSENTNNNMQTLGAVNGNTQSFNVSPIFFRVQTAQGSAATANVTIQVEPCP